MTVGIPQPGARRVLNIAHRGARAFAPENTLEAFAKALQFGCEMIELDVHRSRDGELVVHHDDTLLRCTDVRHKFSGRPAYFISDFSFDEIARLDAGSWFARELALPPKERQWPLQTLTQEEADLYISVEDLAHYASGNVRVPTLRQALALARRTGLRVNIELKMLPRMYSGMTDAVLDLVEDLAMQSEVVISSFDHAQLRQVRRRCPNVQTAVLTNERLALPAEYLELIGANALNTGMDPLGLGSIAGTLDTDAIDSLHRLGKEVNIWTCNDEPTLQRMVSAGVDGLISDYPNRVRKVLDASGSASA